ncbi:MAG TPA: hypothetical protein VML96_04190 [Egibacteraceae bacterium]|nr:hypothetical protein [Egibacteraceae bacterium]
MSVSGATPTAGASKGATALLRGGLGQWSALAALAGIWLTFQALNPRFLSAINLTNLVLQSTALGTIAIGVVLVLMIREIDLSVGAVSGFGAAVVAVLNVKAGWPAAAAIAAGLAVGAAVGGAHGLLVTGLRLPSFVVTLAGLLAWQGALFFVLGETGTVNLQDPAMTALAGTFLSPGVGWALGCVAVAAYAAVVWRRSRARGDHEAGSATGLAVRVLAAAAVGAALVAVFNADRGMPLVAVVFLVLVVLFDGLMTRTAFGRHARAIGSDPDVAARAGIGVDRVRLAIFALTSVLAVTGGIIAASRLLAVNQSSGSTDLMLSAIAAAVIGGTSLFGGRGSIWSALFGSLVIGSVGNGLDLLGVSSSVRFVVTGSVLIIAVALDTFSRRAAASAYE